LEVSHKKMGGAKMKSPGSVAPGGTTKGGGGQRAGLLYNSLKKVHSSDRAMLGVSRKPESSPRRGKGVPLKRCCEKKSLEVESPARNTLVHLEEKYIVKETV